MLNLLHRIIYPVSADLVNHLQRTAIITWYLSHQAGLDHSGIKTAFLAGMLHDIGALSKDRAHIMPGGDGFQDFLQPVTAILENHHSEWSISDNNTLPLVHHLVHMADTFELFLREVKGDFVAQREDILARFFARPEQWPDVLSNAL